MSLIGISYPFRKEDGEYPKRDTDVAAVRSNLLALFNIPARARVMRPELGTTAHTMIFDSIGPLMFSRLQRSILQTIAAGEPRAQVIRIDINTENTLVIVDVLYVVQGYQDSLSLTFSTNT